MLNKRTLFLIDEEERFDDERSWRLERKFVSHTLLSFIKGKLALHRLIRLRQRYVLTRANKVRLRYSISLAVAAGVLLFSAPIRAGLHALISIKKEPHIQAMGEPADKDNSFNDSIAGLEEHISEGMRKAAMAIQKRPPPLDRSFTIGQGDTMAGVLHEAGLSNAESYNAVQALSEFYDVRTIRPGQELKVHYTPGAEDEADLKFDKLVVQISPVKEVSITKADDNFSAEIFEKELLDRSYARQAEIETSLYGSAMKAGIPAAVIANVIRTYSWNVDFQRDIRHGDKIEVLYEAKETEDGTYAKYGDVIYAKLSVGGKDIPIYRFEMKDGRVEYFEADGMSVKKTLMKTPIDGARLSSGFGMRKHPVLGYNKMHKGVDFAAPTGTPIYAAGDGVISYKGRKGGYGNYISIRHNGRLSTAYAHMHKFAKGMGTGKRVKQGQVIGYVGTTGRSTGPHLHYEVLVNGVQKNPNSVDLPTGEQLAGAELDKFKTHIKKIDQQYEGLNSSLRIAQKVRDARRGYPALSCLFTPDPKSQNINYQKHARQAVPKHRILRVVIIGLPAFIVWKGCIKFM